MSKRCCVLFFSSRRRHTRCALVTGVQTCALPIYLCDLHMMPKDDPAWMTKIREFRSMLEKHMAGEENEIFPKLRAQLSDEENKSVTIDRKSTRLNYSH